MSLPLAKERLSNVNQISVTAVLLGQAVRTMLEVDTGRLSGGIYTPACLGREYVDRLEEVGLSIRTKVQDIQGS